MNKTSYISVRVEPDLKTASESILNKLGISHSHFINLMLNQLVINKGMPIPLSAYPYNQETIDAITDKNLSTYNSAEEMMNDLWK